jgi:plastocyanin
MLVEHATEEYLTKLNAVLGREAHLASTQARLEHEMGTLTSQGAKLQATYKAMRVQVDQGDQVDIEAEGVGAHGTSEYARKHSKHYHVHTKGDHPGVQGVHGDLNLNEFDTHTPDIVTDLLLSDMVDIADSFVQTERLSEVLTVAFVEPKHQV